MDIKHVLEAKQFKDKSLLERLFREADELEKLYRAGRPPQTMKGKIMASLFYEPSTRTKFSFESAMGI